MICADAAWNPTASSTYSCIALIAADPLADADTWAGEPTAAPSTGERIVTSAPELVAGVAGGLLAAVPEAAVPPGALLPELGLDEDVVLPEPGVGVLLPVTGELALERLGFVEVPAKLLELPAPPPHPTIAVIRNEKSKIAPCRIVSPEILTGSHTSPIKGSYGCINSGHIRKMP